jgi:hypothetical protein
MALLAPVALVAMALLRATHVPATRLAGRVGVLICCAEAAVLLIAIWGPPAHDRWYATAAATAAFGAVIVASLVGVGTTTGLRRILPIIAILAATIAFVITLVAIWKQLRGESVVYSVVVTLAVLLAYANVVLAIPLPRTQEWVRVITLLAVTITGACIVAAIHLKSDPLNDMAERAGAAAGIVGGCGTLALAVLARLNRRVEFSPTEVTELKELNIVCPLCRKRQTVALGESSCTACGLLFHLRIEEPRCPGCGYVLLMNSSPRCPECGTNLPVSR